MVSRAELTAIIRSATDADFSDAIALLETAALPSADFDARYLAFVAEQDEILLGIIGLEVLDEAGLLRSLVVSESARGRGLGPLLVAALEKLAATTGLEELWLLTVDQARFFSRLGYASRRRDLAPQGIRESREFSTLCPADATLMSKQIMPSA